MSSLHFADFGSSVLINSDSILLKEIDKQVNAWAESGAFPSEEQREKISAEDRD